VELTDELLDMTRLQAGRLELRADLYDLVDLARRVAARLQITTDKHTITVNTSAEYLIALIDQQRIEQVLGNLLINAIKYSPDGGPIVITLEPNEDNAFVTITVRDQGIGIPATQRTRIFNRFARADNARALGIEGTGLGLFLCRELIERHSGRIWFASVEGEGSTFSFTLPLATDAL
jgi:signal transduction histidine kinase